MPDTALNGSCACGGKLSAPEGDSFVQVYYCFDCDKRTGRTLRGGLWKYPPLIWWVMWHGKRMMEQMFRTRIKWTKTPR